MYVPLVQGSTYPPSFTILFIPQVFHSKRSLGNTTSQMHSVKVNNQSDLSSLHNRLLRLWSFEMWHTGRQVCMFGCLEGNRCLCISATALSTNIILVDKAVLPPLHHNTHRTPRDHNTKKKKALYCISCSRQVSWPFYGCQLNVNVYIY